MLTVTRRLVLALVVAWVAFGTAQGPGPEGFVDASSARALPAAVAHRSFGGADVRVTAPGGTNVEPTIAVDPVDPSRLIAGEEHLSGPCTYHVSTDGGMSWSPARVAPLTKDASLCYDIVARASPDGRFFYVSYLSLQSQDSSDVAVLKVRSDFSTAQGPIIAIRHRSGGLVDKDWIDVHEADPSQGSEVYVTATYFQTGVGCSILFTRSVDHGASWSKPVDLAQYPGCSETDIEGIGARALGGIGSTVLSCWYGTGQDGWGPSHGGGGTFDMICRTSLDGGDTWGPVVYPVKGESYELAYYMCPHERYQRLWSSMIPGMAIDPDGSAHLTYARDATQNDQDGDCADVRYTRSSGAPYDTWTAPVTIAGGAEAQSFSAVTATLDPQGRCRVDIAYEDGTNSPSRRPNRVYDVYRVASTDCGLTWSTPQRVSDESSFADVEFVGDYIDMVAVAGGGVHVIWTDRRFARHVKDAGTDIYTDQWQT